MEQICSAYSNGLAAGLRGEQALSHQNIEELARARLTLRQRPVAVLPFHLEHGNKPPLLRGANRKVRGLIL
jgi:hypothetical protein